MFTHWPLDVHTTQYNNNTLLLTNTHPAALQSIGQSETWKWRKLFDLLGIGPDYCHDEQTYVQVKTDDLATSYP